MLAEFRSFLVKSSTLALAIGAIIGAALGSVVTPLVDEIIMPPVGRVLGGFDFSDATRCRYCGSELAGRVEGSIG
jgi:large conductance mechanosensitive channel